MEATSQLETAEGKVVEALQRRPAKWTGLHIIMMRFEKEEWGVCWKAVSDLVNQGIIERKSYILHHDIAQTPTGVLYLYRYLPKMKPELGVVK